jgi:hypothetical protein
MHVFQAFINTFGRSRIATHWPRAHANLHRIRAGFASRLLGGVALAGSGWRNDHGGRGERPLRAALAKTLQFTPSRFIRLAFQFFTL